MKHLILFIYTGSLSIGFICLCLSIVLYIKYRKIILLYFFILVLSLTLMVLPMILRYYQEIIIQLSGTDLDTYFSLFEQIGALLYILSGPLFFHALFTIKKKNILNIIHRLYLLLFIILEILFIFITQSIIIRYLLRIMIHLTTFYGILLGIIIWKTIGDRFIRISVFCIIFSGIIFLPLFFIDSMLPNINFSLPIFYFLLNTSLIGLTVFYFNRPSYLKNGMITDFFKNTFLLSNREAEIITYILKGYSNKKIAEILFISLKTVEAHLYNVYQKTKVKNRIQLFNLLNSNQ